MNRYMVFTNNSVVVDFISQKKLDIQSKWVAASAMDVLIAAKAVLPQGAVLVSDPLVGVRNYHPLFAPSSVQSSLRSPAPTRVNTVNPYLTVMMKISPEGTLDFITAKRLDEAIGIYKKNARLRFLSHSDDAIKEFQAVDLEMLLMVLTTLGG